MPLPRQIEMFDGRGGGGDGGGYRSAEQVRRDNIGTLCAIVLILVIFCLPAFGCWLSDNGFEYCTRH